jgi:hypothetical protein
MTLLNQQIMELLMNIISHSSKINLLSDSQIQNHILHRYRQLTFETDVPPNIILVEATDDITGPDYAFVGTRGLLSDLFEEQEPGHPEFARPYEWASHLPELHLYEALLLVNNEDGYLILIPDAVVEAHPDLKWVLTSNEQGGLSPPQPM